MGRIAVTGSVAYDNIMVFPGRFREHILADKAHVLNVSFLVNSQERRRGGTAANIAYTLALLGEKPLLCAAVGTDFSDDAAELREMGVDVSTTKVFSDINTATCYITTDLEDNQITAFYPGAMGRAAEVDLSSLSDIDTVVVTPDDPAAMEAHIAQAAKIGAQLVFAPAQQIPSLSDGALNAGLENAYLIVGNDYELEMIHERTGQSLGDLSERCMVAVTLGAAGSQIHTPQEMHTIPAVAPEAVVDPTGAGDAYIAGLLAGLRRGAVLDEAGRMASLAATFAVENRGPQAHNYAPEQFAARFEAAFGSSVPAR